MLFPTEDASAVSAKRLEDRKTVKKLERQLRAHGFHPHSPGYDDARAVARNVAAVLWAALEEEWDLRR